MIFNSADRYAGHVSTFLSEENYEMLYGMFSNKIDFPLSFKSFVSYINLMLERCFVESQISVIGTFVDFQPGYDETFFETNTLIATDGSGVPTIFKKENAVIQPGINLILNIASDVTVGDAIKSIRRDIYGIGMTYVDTYQLNGQYFDTLSTEDKNEYYVPILKGIATTLTQEENDLMRLENSRDLIQALTYGDKDRLWAIESYHSGFKTRTSYESFLSLQEEIVGSFNGIYVPVHGSEFLITGQYILEYIFLTHESDLNKLIITFDSDNKILSYDVMNVVRREYDEVE